MGRVVPQNDPTWQGIIYRLASARPDMIVYGCLLAFVNRVIPRPLSDRWRRWVAIGGAAGWVGFFAFLALGNRVAGFELFGGRHLLTHGDQVTGGGVHLGDAHAPGDPWPLCAGLGSR